MGALSLVETSRGPDRIFLLRASFLLFLVLGAQAMTETARDALFLSRLPVTQLPWMYVLVAMTSVGVARAATFFGASLQRALLPPMLLASAVTSLVLWIVAGSRSPAFLYPLYLWPGVFGSVVIVEFWRAVSDVYTITEAKKAFAWLGAGGNAGAAFGSGLAAALTMWLPPHLLLLAAASFLASAIVVSPQWPPLNAEVAAGAPHQAWLSRLESIAGDRYLRGVAGCLFLVALTATLIDFTFKGIVTRDAPPRDLARVFASVSFAINVGAVLLQMTVVRRVIQRLGVTRTIAVLPSVLSVVSLGLVAGAGFLVAATARVVDGSLRYSIHRATSDLLYVPLTPALRARTKTLIDVFTQRGGQVAASVAILLVLHLGGGYRTLAAGMVLIGIAIIAIAFRLTQPYLDLFRATLKKAGTEARLAYPTLDVDSLISLVAAFSSDDERAVMAAMDLVAEKHEVQAIPVVMLFHPSRAVVLRVLTLFERHGRDRFAWAVDRLRREADDPEIRAAALSAYARQRNDDEEALRAALTDGAEAVRMTALVGLIAGGSITRDEVATSIAGAVREASAAGHAALALAIARRPCALFEETLVQLAASPDTTVRLRVAEAMARMPRPTFLPALRAMLSEHVLRPSASLALSAVGPAALEFLSASLETDSLPHAIRLHLPEAIRQFGARKALPVLWNQLMTEPDELMRFKLLRAIGHLVAEEPGTRPDPDAIARAIHYVSQAGLKFAHWRVTLARGAESNTHSDVDTMLRDLLADKQARAVEAIFRLLALSNPAEDFKRIYRGLQGSRTDRASGRELVESVVHPAVRPVVLALLDASADQARLAQFRSHGAQVEATNDEILTAIQADSTGVLRHLAVRRAVELESAFSH